MDLHIVLLIIIAIQALIIISILINLPVGPIKNMTSCHNGAAGASAMNPLNIPIKKEPNR